MTIYIVEDNTIVEKHFKNVANEDALYQELEQNYEEFYISYEDAIDAIDCGKPFFGSFCPECGADTIASDKMAVYEVCTNCGWTNKG